MAMKKSALKKRVKKQSKKTLISGMEAFSVQKTISNSFELFKTNFRSGAVLMILPVLAYALCVVPVVLYKMENAYLIAAAILAGVICSVLFVVYSIAMLKMYETSGSPREKGYFQALFDHAFGKFWPFVKVGLVYFGVYLALFLPSFIILAITQYTGAYMAFIALGFCVFMYLWLVYGQAWVAAALEDASVNAFAESKRLTQGMKLNIFITYLVVMAVMLLVELGMLIVCIPLFLIFREMTVLLAVFGVIFFIAFLVVFTQLMFAFYYSLYDSLRRAAK